MAAIAAVLLAMPFALPLAQASWSAGVTGALFGLLVGAGLRQVYSESY